MQHPHFPRRCTLCDWLCAYLMLGGEGQRSTGYCQRIEIHFPEQKTPSSSMKKIHIVLSIIKAAIKSCSTEVGVHVLSSIICARNQMRFCNKFHGFSSVLLKKGVLKEAQVIFVSLEYLKSTNANRWVRKSNKVSFIKCHLCRKKVSFPTHALQNFLHQNI